MRQKIGAVCGGFKIYRKIVFRGVEPGGHRVRLHCGIIHPSEETMRSHKDQSSRPHDVKKPGKPKGLPGLLLYGALTILGGLALVVVAE